MIDLNTPANLLLLEQLFKVLTQNQYSKLQFIPTRKSLFGFFKEWENIQNLWSRRKHVMFYYSVFPSLYLKLVTWGQPKLRLLYSFCFKNNGLSDSDLENLLGSSWKEQAGSSGLVAVQNGKYVLSYSVLPIGEKLIIRDTDKAYRHHEYDDDKLENRVYVGSDSVQFVQLNQKYLKQQKFRNALELGCGTGIQLITLENIAQRLRGIDINPRAVSFTKVSAELNGLKERLTATLSDLFNTLDGEFDLILANPWFIDIEQAGLEEIPSIITDLDNYLQPGGTFVIFFSSYVKDNVDQGFEALKKFALGKKYSGVFRQLGRNIEPDLLSEYRKHGISHIQNYYAILTKDEKGVVEVIVPSAARRIRDSIFIPIQRALGKRGLKNTG